jgi:hypothetical protein
MEGIAQGFAPRVYRIKPWPIRIGVPLMITVAVLGVLHVGAIWAVPIPIVLGALWMYGGEWCGLVVTAEGIESRMTRSANRFGCAWMDIDDFKLVDNGYEVAIVVCLRDDSRRLLPSSRAWLWDRHAVKQIYEALKRDLAASRTTSMA